MSAKSESLPLPITKALLRLTPGEPVEVHWPDGSIETVTVIRIHDRLAQVERTTSTNFFDKRIDIDVRRDWLHPIKNA